MTSSKIVITNSRENNENCHLSSLIKSYLCNSFQKGLQKVAHFELLRLKISNADSVKVKSVSFAFSWKPCSVLFLGKISFGFKFFFVA